MGCASCPSFLLLWSASLWDRLYSGRATRSPPPNTTGGWLRPPARAVCFEVGLTPGFSSRGAQADLRGSPPTSAEVPWCLADGTSPSQAREPHVLVPRPAPRAEPSGSRSTVRSG